MAENNNSVYITTNINDDDKLNEIINNLKNGQNIFVTGGAGTGKSYILTKIKSMFGDDLHLTGTTGISAFNINGRTIHSWAGIGLLKDVRKDFNTEFFKTINKIKSNEFLYQKIYSAKMLAIDEISMLDNETFDFLNKVLKRIRNNNKPFGGIQILLFGDFFQLPPISLKDVGYDFCFYSKAWDELNLKTTVLSKVHRQSDMQYIDALNNIREGKIEQKQIDMFNQRVEDSKLENKENVTQLFGTNDEVKDCNSYYFNQLTSPIFKMESEDVLEEYQEKNNEKYFLSSKKVLYNNTYEYVTNSDIEKEIKGQINNFNKNECRTPSILKLRVGAKVMLTRNIAQDRGLVNGRCGEVTDIGQEQIEVKFGNDIDNVSIERVTFEYYIDDYHVFKRKQFPLVLAYAMTIHKSQGLTFNKMAVNFNKIFDAGQGYVALSRTRSFDGLLLDSFDKELIVANTEVKHFYHVLNEKKYFSRQDYPDSKLKRLKFEEKLDFENNNDELKNKKINKIKKSIDNNEDIKINYYEKKAEGKLIRERLIKPYMIDTGDKILQSYPSKYNLSPSKYYVHSHCYSEDEDRDFKLDMICILPDVSEREIKEDEQGITYDDLFGKYINGAKNITVIDPYIQIKHQILNFNEFIKVIKKYKSESDIIKLKLVTRKLENDPLEQTERLNKIKENCSRIGIDFSFEYDPVIHDRSIETDDWKINLGRGLDIFKRCERNDPLQPTTNYQEYRSCMKCGITYLKK